MKLPSPRDQLAGCVWLPRIIAKARSLNRGELPAEYVARFCHTTGVDGQFISFFSITREEILVASAGDDAAVVAWFKSLPAATEARIAEWNHRAVNLGRPGFPMAERIGIALSTTYKHLAHRNLETVFAVLEADEEPA